MQASYHEVRFHRSPVSGHSQFAFEFRSDQYKLITDENLSIAARPIDTFTLLQNNVYMRVMRDKYTNARIKIHWSDVH